MFCVEKHKFLMISDDFEGHFVCLKVFQLQFRNNINTTTIGFEKKYWQAMILNSTFAWTLYYL